MSLLRQSIAVTNANIRSIGRRFWISLSLVFSVALVVMVLLGFLAMANGFNKSLDQAGSDDIALVLSPGARSELGSRIAPPAIHLLQEAPGIARDDKGNAFLSTELVVPVDVMDKAEQQPATLSLRGIGERGLAVRPSIRISEGRMFELGANELLVGKRLAQDYENLAVGDSINFGKSQWTVVGTFEAGGSVFESEMLADKSVVQTLFNRSNLTQSIRAKLENPQSLSTLEAFIEANPQMPITVRSEKSYFAAQSERVSQIILWLGWPLAMIMALGAVIGALTTMYSSVSDRTVEIATVRAIGFSRFSAFVGTWVEALVLTIIGCAVGTGLSILLLDGWAASTVGADNTQIAFTLSLSLPIILNAVGLALIIGAVGGGLPAFRATQVPLRLAMTGRS